MSATSVLKSGERRAGLRCAGDRRMFLVVSLVDVMACNLLGMTGMTGGIWLLNLPATITLGRLASLAGGDAVALAVTIPAGAAFYGWAAVHLSGASSRSNRARLRAH